MTTLDVCLGACGGQTPRFSLMVFTPLCRTPPHPWDVGEPVTYLQPEEHGKATGNLGLRTHDYVAYRCSLGLAGTRSPLLAL